MKTNAEKALVACAQYAKLNSEIKALSSLIGDCLGACLSAQIVSGNGGKVESHLSTAYTFEYTEGDFEYSDGRRYLTEEEQLEVLAECPHCMTAHKAVQDRKKARKAFGAAKRSITKIGRSA